MNKIKFLEKQNNKLKNELKIELYPNGSLVYIIDYSDEQLSKKSIDFLESS